MESNNPENILCLGLLKYWVRVCQYNIVTKYIFAFITRDFLLKNLGIASVEKTYIDLYTNNFFSIVDTTINIYLKRHKN